MDNTNTNKTVKMEGGYTSRFDNNPKKAQEWMEALRHVCSQSEVDIEELWATVDTMSIEEREKKVKRQLKRVSNKAAQFKATTIAKPPNRMNLFRKRFKEECAENGDKYSKDTFAEAYAALSSDELAALDEEVAGLKAEYEADYEKERVKAIYNGDFTPPDIKRALSAYMIFGMCCHSKNNKYLPKSIIKKLNDMPSDMSFGDMGKFIKTLWSSLTAKQKEVFSKLNEEAKAKYLFQVYERNIIIANGNIRRATREEDTDAATKFEEELVSLTDNPPEGYEAYTSSSDYQPLYDFTSFVDEE
jgi:hypothetical protein